MAEENKDPKEDEMLTAGDPAQQPDALHTPSTDPVQEGDSGDQSDKGKKKGKKSVKDVIDEVEDKVVEEVKTAEDVTDSVFGGHTHKAIIFLASKTLGPSDYAEFRRMFPKLK